MEWVSGNVMIRPNLLAKAGDVLPGHLHNFDHTLIVFKGSLRIHGECPDARIVEKEFVAPSHALVLKDVIHTITALQDDTEFWCVYSHRHPNGEISQEWTGWNDAYG